MPSVNISITIINQSEDPVNPLIIICLFTQGHCTYPRMFSMRHCSFTATSIHRLWLSSPLLLPDPQCVLAMWYRTTQAFNTHLQSHRRLSHGGKRLNAQNTSVIFLTSPVLLITLCVRRKRLCLRRSGGHLKICHSIFPFILINSRTGELVFTELSHISKWLRRLYNTKWPSLCSTYLAWTQWLLVFSSRWWSWKVRQFFWQHGQLSGRSHLLCMDTHLTSQLLKRFCRLVWSDIKPRLSVIMWWAKTSIAWFLPFKCYIYIQSINRDWK